MNIQRLDFKGGVVWHSGELYYKVIYPNKGIVARIETQFNSETSEWKNKIEYLDYFSPKEKQALIDRFERIKNYYRTSWRK